MNTKELVSKIKSTSAELFKLQQELINSQPMNGRFIVFSYKVNKFQSDDRELADFYARTFIGVDNYIIRDMK